jgi:beta-lactamase class A
MWTRREWLMRTAAAVPAWRAAGPMGTPAAAARHLTDGLAAVERRIGGRLGVAFLDTGSGKHASYRADERFRMCSTFKLLAVAHVLTRVDAGAEHLDRRIAYGQADLLAYAPITRAHVAEGHMTVEALCDAAITYSDNTAANLLLNASGGPAGVTQFARAIGDTVTRLDRFEPDLNDGPAGDPRDTTTPAAMLSDVRALLVETTRLSSASRTRLADWLVANTTGAGKLRAGVPANWRIGDKTGNGGHNATNDVAIAWPPNRAPVLIAVYSSDAAADTDARNAALAEVARIVTSA